MKPKLFFVIVCIQIIMVTFLFLKIQERSMDILGVSINTIDSKTIQKSPSSELMNFYEPKANTSEIVHEEWLPYAPVYSINRDSLNERFNYNVKKNEGIFRIITLGDSFTYGENVFTKDNWTEILEDRLNKEKICQKIQRYEVINLGVGGYDTTYEVERYKIRGQKYQPDLVIWYITDLYRITDETITLANKMNVDEKNNEKKGIFYESWNKAREKIIREHGKIGLVKYQISKLKEFRERYYQNGPLLFISLWKEVQNNFVGKAIYYGDTHVTEDKKNLLPDLHFNNSGHIKFADEVMNTLVKDRLLPCD